MPPPRTLETPVNPSQTSEKDGLPLAPGKLEAQPPLQTSEKVDPLPPSAPDVQYSSSDGLPLKPPSMTFPREHLFYLVTAAALERERARSKFLQEKFELRRGICVTKPEVNAALEIALAKLDSAAAAAAAAAAAMEEKLAVLDEKTDKVLEKQVSDDSFKSRMVTFGVDLIKKGASGIMGYFTGSRK